MGAVSQAEVTWLTQLFATNTFCHLFITSKLSTGPYHSIFSLSHIFFTLMFTSPFCSLALWLVHNSTSFSLGSEGKMCSEFWSVLSLFCSKINQQIKGNWHSTIPIFKTILVIIAVAAALQCQTCDVTFQARRTGRLWKFPLLSTLSYKKLHYLLLHLLRWYTALFIFQLSEGLKAYSAACTYFHSVWDEQHIFTFAAWQYVSTKHFG